MKLTRYIRTLVLMLILSSVMNNVKGQIDELRFIYGPNGDARILLQNYMQPYTDFIGSNLNAAWYNTANVHKLGGLDITAMFTFVSAPAEVLQNDLSLLLGLSEPFSDPTFAPTVVGNMTDLPEIVTTTSITDAGGLSETAELARYIHPNGMGRHFVPLPMTQISIGLIKGTEITGRYMPNMDIGFGTKTGMWGIGGKHSISQWIPIIKKLKFIDIAVQGGYSKVSSSVHQSLPALTEITPDPFPDFEGDDQYLVMDISGWTVNLIASQSIPVITIYEGIGYASSMAEVAMLGQYAVNDVVDDPSDANFGQITYSIVEDPITELQMDGYKGLRLNAGLRLKLGVLTLHYDFTKTMYVTHTGGVGITFR